MSTSHIDGTIDMSDTATITIEPPQPAASLPAPRLRWAAVIWGLMLSGTAAVTLWVVISDARREEFVDWLTALSPASVIGYSVLAVGALLLVTGAIGLIRRAQKRAHARASAAR